MDESPDRIKLSVALDSALKGKPGAYPKAVPGTALKATCWLSLNLSAIIIHRHNTRFLQKLHREIKTAVTD